MTDMVFEKTSSRGLTKEQANINIRWRRWVLPVGVFLIALLPRLISLNVFLTADEDDQIMFAHFLLKSLVHGKWERIFMLYYPGVPTLLLGTGGVALRYALHYIEVLPLPWVDADLKTTLIEMTSSWGTIDHPLDFIWWVRTPMAVMAALSILGIFLLSRRLIDERLALLSTLIIAFDPFILAHTRIVHVDAPQSYFMFLCFLAFILYMDKGAWKWLILSGLFGGLAVLSKSSAVILGPILLISGVIYALFPPSGQTRLTRWRRLGVALLVAAIIIAVSIYSFWSFVEKLALNVQSVYNGIHPTSGLFWTEIQSDQNPFYYLWVFPFHLTPLVTIGILTGLVMIVMGVVAYMRNRENWSSRILPLALSLLVYIVVFIAITSVVSRRGDRYILPVYFSSGMLAALALWWVAGYVPGFFRRFKITSMQILGVAVALQMLFVLLYHPYYLSYFNPLMGGYRTAPYWINVGWGEGLDKAADYLNGMNGTKNTPPPVASWYSKQFAPFYHGPTIDLSSQGAALVGGYTVFYINQIQRGFPSREVLTYFQQRDPLEIVKIGGIPYAWIYQGPVVSQSPPEDYAFPVEVLLGGGARLIGLDIPETHMPVDAYTFSPGEKEWAANHPYSAVEGIPVTLYWETVGKIQGNHNVYIRLVDNEGNIWGQVDRMILAGLWRPQGWYTGYFLRDEYKLPVDPATPPGTYHFEVGMYDFVSGESYGVVKNIGEITLKSPERLPQPAEIDVETQLLASINDSLTLVGHDYSDASLPPGGELAGKVFWQAVDDLADQYKVEFSLLDTELQKEYIVAKNLLSPSYPTSQWQKSEVVGAAYRFRIPAVAPPGTYPLALNVIHPQTGERIGQPITLADITVEALDRNFELPQNVAPISAVINNEIELVGYKLVNTMVPAGEKFGLILYWRSLNFAESNYTVFVHAVGPDQVIRGQWDSVPAQGASPTGGWVPGEIIEDYFTVPMTEDAPPWKYDIFVGMYNPVTGERLNIDSQNAPVSDNRVWLTRVQILEE